MIHNILGKALYVYLFHSVGKSKTELRGCPGTEKIALLISTTEKHFFLGDNSCPRVCGSGTVEARGTTALLTACRSCIKPFSQVLWKL